MAKLTKIGGQIIKQGSQIITCDDCPCDAGAECADVTVVCADCPPFHILTYDNLDATCLCCPGFPPNLIVVPPFHTMPVFCDTKSPNSPPLWTAQEIVQGGPGHAVPGVWCVVAQVFCSGSSWSASFSFFLVAPGTPVPCFPNPGAQSFVRFQLSYAFISAPVPDECPPAQPGGIEYNVPFANNGWIPGPLNECGPGDTVFQHNDPNIIVV